MTSILHGGEELLARLVGRGQRTSERWPPRSCHELELRIPYPAREGQLSCDAAVDIVLGRPGDQDVPAVGNSGHDEDWLQLRFSPAAVLAVPEGCKLLRPFYQLELPQAVQLSPASSSAVLAACRRICEERRHRQPGWQAAQLVCLTDILVQLLRSRAGDQSDDVLNERMIATVEHILTHLPEELPMPELIELYGRGKTSFYRDFRQVTGLSPNQFIQSLRMQRAMRLLQTTDKSVTEIAYDCGYHSLSYFNRHFKQYRKLSPREHRCQAAESGEAEREASYA